TINNNGIMEKYNSIITDNTINKKNKNKKKFVPPTIKEIENYCRQRKNNVNAKRFYDYYAAANWKDSQGKPIKNWKQKIIAVWEKKKSVKTEKKLKNGEDFYMKLSK
ncbi:MAG: hypothetical protein LUH11_03260, partial [Candidatus Gastranaerophilales bacterium]|nr:hypothetical protein [Candidatus Gastranaerophilales bacterium]